MKIRSIRLHPVATKRRTGVCSLHVIVEMIGDGDLCGFGEMSDFGHLPLYVPNLPDLERVLNMLLVGIDADDFSELAALLLAAYPEGYHVYDMGSVIRSGVDLAAHDLVARARGIGVAELLGGAKRRSIPVCYPIFRARSIADIPARLAQVDTALALGFTNIRYYFGRDIDADDRLLEEIRARHGARIHLKSLDASNLLDARTAIDAINRLARHGATMCESPTHRFDIRGTAEVRKNVDLPISEHIYHETHARALIDAGAIDIMNVCLTFAGGLSPAMRLMELAKEARLRTLIGTTQELSIGTAAQVHLGCAAATLTDISDPTGPCLYAEDITAARVLYRANEAMLPEGPGFGIAPDPALLERQRTDLAVERALPANRNDLIAILDRT